MKNFWRPGFRVFFRKKKHREIRRFFKMCSFPRKLFLLNLKQKCQNNFEIGEFDPYLPFWVIQMPFCQIKVVFVDAKTAFTKNDFDLIPFILKPLPVVFYQIFIFAPNDSPLKNYENFFFISSKKLFSLSKYSNICNFFPSFTHVSDSKGQIQVE